MPHKVWKHYRAQFLLCLGVVTMVTTNGHADEPPRREERSAAAGQRMPAAGGLEVKRFVVEGYPIELRPHEGTALSFNALETMERTYVLYDLGTGTEVKRVRQALDTGHCELSPDGRWMAGVNNRTARDGRTEGIVVWSTRDDAEFRAGGKHDEDMKGIVWLPDGKRLLTWARDTRVCLWDAGTDGGKPRLLGCFTNKDWIYTSVVPSPDSTHAAAAPGGGGQVAILDTSGDSIKLIRRLPKIPDPHYKDVGGGVFVDTITGYRMTDVGPEGMGMCFTAVAFFPDGRQIVTAASDGTLLVLDTETGEELARHHEADSGRTMRASVAASPDGTRVLFAAGTAPARLWDWKNGRILATILSHARAEDGEHGGVSTLAFTQDGKHALTGGVDGAVRVWKLPE